MLVRWRWRSAGRERREHSEQYKLAGSYRTPVKMSRPPEKRMCECGMVAACVMRAGSGMAGRRSWWTCAKRGGDVRVYSR